MRIGQITFGNVRQKEMSVSELHFLQADNNLFPTKPVEALFEKLILMLENRSIWVQKVGFSQ